MCKTTVAGLVLYCLLFLFKDPAQAGVIGKVSCDGRSVGFAIDVTGPIEDATFDEVREVFKKYHQQQNELANGRTCPELGLRGKQLDFSAYGHRFSIDSAGGSVIAAIKIGRLLRQSESLYWSRESALAHASLCLPVRSIEPSSPLAKLVSIVLI